MTERRPLDHELAEALDELRALVQQAGRRAAAALAWARHASGRVRELHGQQPRLGAANTRYWRARGALDQAAA